PFDVDDEAYGDGQMTQEAIKLLRQASGQAEPFIFMVGFQKPHLPFNAPKKYWDLYDPVSPPGEPELETLPKHGSRLEIRRNHELWRYREGFSLREPPAGAAAARLRQAYAACISYVDAQVGTILEELDALGLADDTIVVLWSDHGYQLGHLGSWTKRTNFEMTAGSPLIISAPGFERGVRSTKVVESVDLFPTLVDLCGLAPLNVTDGESLRPLLANPMDGSWSRPAFHLVGGGNSVGRAVRDERYRYVEWRKGWERDSELIDTELYDYEQHPEERINVVDDPDYQAVKSRFKELLWSWN
ncbi:MAG: sulfatase-like hydrolase/transferase, partial [Planctomycetota bacterium]